MDDTRQVGMHFALVSTYKATARPESLMGGEQETVLYDCIYRIIHCFRCIEKSAAQIGCVKGVG